MADLEIPAEKSPLLHDAEARVERFQRAYSTGQITFGERYNKVIDAWTHANNDIAEAMVSTMRKSKGGFNPVFMMFDSGSRGSLLVGGGNMRTNCRSRWGNRRTSPVFSISRSNRRRCASLGVATFPADGPDSDALLRNADKALYEAKARGLPVRATYSGEAISGGLRMDLADLVGVVETLRRLRPRP